VVDFVAKLNMEEILVVVMIAASYNGINIATVSSSLHELLLPLAKHGWIK
jgi:hypothetical protein